MKIKWESFSSRNDKAASANPNEAKGRIFKKIDTWRAKFSENFNDFVDFSLKERFLEKVEVPQKRASRAADWPTLW
jgi:hypothetical protein